MCFLSVVFWLCGGSFDLFLYLVTMCVSSGGLGCFWSWRVLLHILVLSTASAGYLFLLVAGGVGFSAWLFGWGSLLVAFGFLATVVLRFFLVLYYFAMEVIIFNPGYWDQLGYWMEVYSSDTGARMGAVLIWDYHGVKCVAGFAPCVWFNDVDLSRELVDYGACLARD